MIGATQLALDEADGVHRQRAPAAGSSTRPRCRRAQRAAGSPAPASTCSSASRRRTSPLLALPNIVVTPHLGASTDEAQEKAGVSVARVVRLALGGELVPDAVNVAGGVIDPYVRPGIPLVEKLGQVFAGLAARPDHQPRRRGARRARRLRRQRAEARRAEGRLHERVSENVCYVNAPLLAEQRGMQVRLITDPVSDEYRNVISVRGAPTTAARISVSGTLTGPKQVEKITEIDGYDVEVPLAEPPRRVFTYTDRPGIVAHVRRRVRRGGHQHRGHADRPRGAAGAEALSVLTIDSPAAATRCSTTCASGSSATSLQAIDLVED